MSPEQFQRILTALPMRIASDPMDAEKEEMGELIREAQEGNFEREEDESGAAWAPRKGSYDHPPLRDTLAMFNAATSKGAPGNLQEHGPGYLVVGIDGSVIGYAIDHNDGIGQVQRRFFYLREEDLEKLDVPLRKAMKRIVLQTSKEFAGG